jgi:hypothetical protein
MIIIMKFKIGEFEMGLKFVVFDSMISVFCVFCIYSYKKRKRRNGPNKDLLLSIVIFCHKSSLSLFEKKSGGVIVYYFAIIYH